jgi:hypothetical protein
LRRTGTNRNHLESFFPQTLASSVKCIEVLGVFFVFPGDQWTSWRAQLSVGATPARIVFVPSEDVITFVHVHYRCESIIMTHCPFTTGLLLAQCHGSMQRKPV